MSSWEFPTTGPIEATVRIPAGSVTVTAAPASAAQVRIVPGRWGGEDVAAATRVEYESGRLVVAAPNNKRLFRRASANLDVTITVPPGSTCGIQTVSASIHCGGEFGELSAHTVSGDINAERVTGQTEASTSSGAVRLDRTGPVRAKTISGDILIGAADSDVDSETVNSNVEVGSVAAGRVAVKTISGDITVGVASGTGVQLDLSTISGKATDELDHSGPAGVAEATVICRTVSGDVTVRRARHAPGSARAMG
jgi:hypothetical protein